MSRTVRMSVHFATAALGLWLASMDAASAQDSVRKYQIAEQPLGQALREFALANNLDLLFSPDLVAGKKSPSLDGKFTVDGGLRTLLRGSGLEFSVSGSRIVINEAKTGPARQVTSSNSTLTGTDKYTRLAQAESATASQFASPAVSETKSEDSSRQRIELEEIVVTGTHIRGKQVSSGNLIVIGREQIEAAGFGTTSQLVASIPQNFGGDASATVTATVNRGFSSYNTGAGTAVNLRGLGSSATLTLLNGNRMSPAGQGTFVDVSLIPLSAIERVEILTDGASAVYGSDAIGGVVNIITRRDYEGAETMARIGSVTSGGRRERAISQLFGHSWAAGNITLNYEYSEEDALTYLDRPELTSGNGTQPYDLLPKQTANSLTSSFRFDIGSRAAFTADLLATDRQFRQRVNPARLPAIGSGDSIGVSVAPGLHFGLGSNWTADVVGTASRNALDRRLQIFGTRPQDGRSRNTYETWSGEVRLNGELANLPAGTIRLAAGGAFRSEESDTQTTNGSELYRADRKIWSAYAELWIPLLGRDDSSFAGQRLDLSLAGRFDDYSDFGHTTNPRAALTWQPLPGLVARTTYSKSFHAPLFLQTSNHQFQGAYILDVPDPQSTRADQMTTTITWNGSNPNLGPETARSWTAGLDLRPSASLRASLNYFDISYRDRIIDLQSLDPLGFLSGPAFADFVTRNPSPALLSSILEPLTQVPGSLSDFNRFIIGIPDVPTFLDGYTIGALWDARMHNSAESDVRGIDLEATWTVTTPIGGWSAGLLGSYLLEYSTRFSSQSPATDYLNRVFQPVDLRLRGSLGWARRGLGATVFVNYVDSYDDLGTVYSTAGAVASWTTVDAQIRYEVDRSSSSWARGVGLSLSVLNAFDRLPPHIDPLPGQFAFDAENASPLGRFIALAVTKKW